MTSLKVAFYYSRQIVGEKKIRTFLNVGFFCKINVRVAFRQKKTGFESINWNHSYWWFKVQVKELCNFFRRNALAASARMMWIASLNDAWEYVSRTSAKTCYDIALTKGWRSMNTKVGEKVPFFWGFEKHVPFWNGTRKKTISWRLVLFLNCKWYADCWPLNKQTINGFWQAA